MGFCAFKKILLPLLLLLATGNALAVVVTGPDDGRTVPADLPLGNVGKLGGATGVYLDNGWVLTTGRTNAGDIIFGSETYCFDGVHDIRIKNPEGYKDFISTDTDLRLFRLTEIPDLPALSIPDTSPGVGEALYYAGYGTKASEELTNWTYSWRDGWNEVDYSTSLWGYKLVGPRELNWGQNTAIKNSGENGPTDDTFYITFVDSGVSGIAFASVIESQMGDAGAVDGDFGGAAFCYGDDGTGKETWMLAGIISMVGLSAIDPPTLTMNGACTFSVALSFYRDQILDLISPEAIPGDANGDGQVDSSDIAILAGNWRETITGTEEQRRAAGDFNNDGIVDNTDMFILVDHWQDGTEFQAGITISKACNLAYTSVPEPSLLFSLLVGGLVFLVFLRK